MKNSIPTLLFMIFPALSFAHDIWLEGSVKNERLQLELNLGHGKHSIKQLKYDKRFIPKFEMVDVERSQATSIAGFDALELKTIGCETFFAMEREWFDITLPKDKFKEYLIEEKKKNLLGNLASINSEKIKERYYRTIKYTPKHCDKKRYLDKANFGFLSTKIVSVDKLKQKFNIKFNVLFEDKPIQGFFLEARHDSLPEGVTLSSTSDQKGNLAFDLPFGGEWLFRGLLINKSAKKDYHFDSYWHAHLVEL